MIKVLDFGIAKETASAVGEATKTGEVMGSPHYMSPEQASAEKGVDHRADLWSVGVILYRMVTGALPFPGEAIGAVLSRILVHPVPPVHAAAPDLPTSLDDFFAKALAKPKEQRFQSIRDLIDAFVAISGGVPVGPTGAVTLATSVPDAASSLDPDSGNTNVATIPLPAAGVLPFQKPPHGAPPAGNPPPAPVDASAGTLTAANTSRDHRQARSVCGSACGDHGNRAPHRRRWSPGLEGAPAGVQRWPGGARHVGRHHATSPRYSAPGLARGGHDRHRLRDRHRADGDREREPLSHDRGAPDRGSDDHHDDDPERRGHSGQGGPAAGFEQRGAEATRVRAAAGTGLPAGAEKARLQTTSRRSQPVWLVRGLSGRSATACGSPIAFPGGSR